MNNKSIFDTLPTMPEGAEAAGDADTERIRELVHKGLAAQKSPHHTKKRHRYIPMLVAAVVITVAILSCSIVVFSEEDLHFQTPEEKMQEQIHSMFMEKWKNGVRSLSSGSEDSMLSFSAYGEAVESENKVVFNIMKRHNKAQFMDKYLSFREIRTLEDYDKYYLYISECCELCRDESITLEEKVRIENYILEAYYKMDMGFCFNELNYTNENIRIRFPEIHEHWVNAWNTSYDLLRDHGRL